MGKIILQMKQTTNRFDRNVLLNTILLALSIVISGCFEFALCNAFCWPWCVRTLVRWESDELIQMCRYVAIAHGSQLMILPYEPFIYHYEDMERVEIHVKLLISHRNSCIPANKSIVLCVHDHFKCYRISVALQMRKKGC